MNLAVADIVVLVLVALAVATAAWFFWPRDPVNVAMYHRIRLGASVEEVEATLGRPGLPYEGWFESHKHILPPETDERYEEGVPFEDSDNALCWSGRKGWLLVRYDKDRRVTTKLYQGWQIPPVPDSGWFDME
jgi:hypothetical protein